MTPRKLLFWSALLCASLLSACRDDISECTEDDDCPLGERCVIGECQPYTPAGDATNADIPTGSDGTSGDVSACTGIPPVTELKINEVLPSARNGDPAWDSNCDGNASSTQDEFVEIVNDSDKILDLQGVQLQVGGSLKHTINACLQPGQGIVVYSGGVASCTDLGATLAVVSEKSLGLTNSGNIVSLNTAGGDTLDSVVYPDLSSSDASYVRNPDYSGEDFLSHLEVNPELASSPGKCTSGADLARGCPGVDVGDGVEGDAIDGEVVTCAGGVAPVAQLKINEVLSSPLNGVDDSNCDGNASSTQDEFVEIVNASEDILDLQGVQLEVGGALKHTINACLQPGQGIVVYSGGVASCDLGATLAVVSDSSLSLTNGGNTVSLSTAGGATLDSVTYPDLSSDDTSYTRSPDYTGEFVPHLDANASLTSSPGMCTNGEALAPGCNDPDVGDAIAESDDVSSDTLGDATGDTTVGDTTAGDTTAGDTTAGDTTDTVDPPACDPPTVDDLVLNEILYDPSTDFTAGAYDQTGGDANCDQNRSSTQDEFIEFVNVSSVPVNLDGVEFALNGTVEHTFGETCLQPNQAVVLFAGGTPDLTNCPEMNDDVVQVMSFTLTNSGGTITIQHPTIAATGFTLGSFTWPGTGYDNDVNMSVQRNPDLTGTTFAIFTDVTGCDPGTATCARQSPGACADGNNFADGCP